MADFRHSALAGVFIFLTGCAVTQSKLEGPPRPEASPVKETSKIFLPASQGYANLGEIHAGGETKTFIIPTRTSGECLTEAAILAALAPKNSGEAEVVGACVNRDAARLAKNANPGKQNFDIRKLADSYSYNCNTTKNPESAENIRDAYLMQTVIFDTGGQGEKVQVNPDDVSSICTTSRPGVSPGRLIYK